MPTDLTAPRTAIVIGGGVVGQAIAFRLQERGCATTLIDEALNPRGASWGNAGHIATEQVEPLASYATLKSVPGRLFGRGGAVSLPLRDIGAWGPFGLRLALASRLARAAVGREVLGGLLGDAMAAWERLLERVGRRQLLREQGHYVVWESQASAAAGRRAWGEAATGTARFRDVDRAELDMLRRLGGADLAGAIRFEGSGQIGDLEALAAALSGAFATLGGARWRGRVDGIGQKDGRPCVRLQDGTAVASDAVVVAAGVKSGALLRPLGHRVPIIAERGYHIQSAAPGWPEDMPPIVFEDRAMIVTRFRIRLRAASFVEFSRAESPPDARKWRRLEGHVAALGVPIRGEVERWMGCRPTLPDYLPAIGKSGRLPGLYYAFGHQHLGLTLAAVTGEMVADMMAEVEEVRADLSHLSLDRFGT